MEYPLGQERYRDLRKRYFTSPRIRWGDIGAGTIQKWIILYSWI